MRVGPAGVAITPKGPHDVKFVISTLIAINLNLQLGPGAFIKSTNFVGTP